MSYEAETLSKWGMPTRQAVEQALLVVLLKHNGVVREFGSGEEIVSELADFFELNAEQRLAELETIYQKERRLKRVLVWHRLLFRAADSLAKLQLVSRPTVTQKLTNRREWMLTEKGVDRALELASIPPAQKDDLPIKSFEVQKIVKKFNEALRPEKYNPFDVKKKTVEITREAKLRARGFRQAVIAAYDFKCAFCGLKIPTPDSTFWEVEAAHIVPHTFRGKDDIWNGLALCRLHHWAFDVGWFCLQNDFTIKVSARFTDLPSGYGLIEGHNFLASSPKQSGKIYLPEMKNYYPHEASVTWHRENRFCD